MVFSIRSGRGTAGRCAGPKWPKMVKMTILVKMSLFRTGFWYNSRDQNEPKWSIFALKTHTPQIWEVKFTPREPPKITCFAVFFRNASQI